MIVNSSSYTSYADEVSRYSECLSAGGQSLIFGRTFVKWFTVCYQTVCLSVLSVMLVYCGQTVGWIKMKLGRAVSLGLGHIVLDGDPALPLEKGHSLPPIFGPCLFWPNGWMV